MNFYKKILLFAAFMNSYQIVPIDFSSLFKKTKKTTQIIPIMPAQKPKNFKPNNIETKNPNTDFFSNFFYNKSNQKKYKIAPTNNQILNQIEMIDENIFFFTQSFHSYHIKTSSEQKSELLALGKTIIDQLNAQKNPSYIQTKQKEYIEKIINKLTQEE